MSSDTRPRLVQRSARRVSAAVVAVALVASACTGGGGGSAGSSTTTPATSGPPTTEPEPLEPFEGLRLSKGEAVDAPAETVPVVAGDPLDDDAVAAVVSRLPEWLTDPGLALPFTWPTETRPAPRAGTTVDTPFPLPATAGPAPTTPPATLSVLRAQPDGEVAVAPFVTVTFDQPMVPVATLGSLDAQDVPATLSPDVPGRWQWLGTSTLRFDAEVDGIDRLPMATEYTLTVPAGARSASGARLAADAVFRFATPAPTVQSFLPTGEALPLQPVFVATFDQRVDPEAVVRSITLRAGDDDRPVRLATADEVEADDLAREITENALDGRWVALRPVDPLPADTPITVTVVAGTPSAEGPRTMVEDHVERGRTYGPLRITDVGCDWGDACPPGSGIAITFSNELDLERFDPATVGVEPAIPGATAGAYGNVVVITGATKGRTTYRVTVPAGLTDVYGQTLGQDETREVEIGPATPALFPFDPYLTTADPFVGPKLLVRTMNHDDVRVRVFRVSPADYPAYLRFVNDTWQRGDADAVPPFTEVSDDVVLVDAADDAAVETPIELGGVMGGDLGHAVVLVETTERYPTSSPEYWQNRPTITWVQATRLGVDALADRRQAVVWTTDLRDGSPVPGATVGFTGQQETASTDGNGTATLPLPNATDSRWDTALVASAGDDTALLATQGMARDDATDDTRWYVIDDRGAYRPGETVSLKGWVRRLTTSTDGRLALFPAGTPVTYQLLDAQGVELAGGQVTVDDLGGFDLTVELPPTATPGPANLGLVLVDGAGLIGAGSHSFTIAEFRRPEFEVTTQAQGTAPFLQGNPLGVEATATYFAGGPLGDAPVLWTVSAAEARFAPPGWDDFTFGRWIPWWYEGPWGGYEDVTVSEPCCGQAAATETFDGRTDAAGTDRLRVDVGRIDPELDGLPLAVSAQADVTDVNRQVFSSTTNVVVHPAAVTVGLRAARPFVREGTPLTIDTIVTDVDGTAVADRPVTVVASRLTAGWRDGEWTEERVDPQDCTITSAATPVACEFTTGIGGTYEIVATVTDADGRTSRSELTAWVSGAESLPSRNVQAQALTLVPADREPVPGTETSILVQAPFAGGHGLLTLSRNGIRRTAAFTVTDGSATVSFPVTEDDVPGLLAVVEVVGTSPRLNDDGTVVANGPPAPAFATGQLFLPVSRATRTLTVTATPAATTLPPGGATTIDVLVQGPDGAPVAGSQLAVLVVDEAVLALTGYRLADPLAAFYDRLGEYLTTVFGRQSIVLTNPASLGATGGEGDGGDASASPTTAAAAETTAAQTDESAPPAPGAADQARDRAGGAGTTVNPVIDVRTDLDALALFEPAVPTGADGRASVGVTLPDSLTRYRVMVVAVDGAERFGSAESTITARLPIMVRPSPPRFVNFGDTFELPVVLQNQTDTELSVDVVAQTDNLSLTGPVGQRVSVPANDRVEVRFPAAAQSAGTARIRIAAVAGDASDAVTVELPAYTPSTTETFATYGVVDEGAIAQPLLAPTDVIPQFGGLDITTSSTALQELTDAVLYLDEYRYASSDAYASRILAISSLRDVLDAFDAPGLASPADLDATVRSDIDGLVAMQNADGGFPYWRRGDDSSPFNSLQATHALLVARAAGFAVPDATVDPALGYARSVEQHFEEWYDQATKDSLSAYALWVRALADDRDTGKADDLFGGRWEELPLDAVAWLWPVVADGDAPALARIVANRAVDTAGAVSFTEAVSEGDYVTLRSDRRTDGLVLDAFLARDPASDLVPKLVTGLLAARPEEGRWGNVQENAFILVAMKRYFDAFEAQDPSFVARVWLGEQFAAETAYVGRSTNRNRVTIPTAQLQELGDQPVVVSRDPAGDAAAGRLYYRIGLRTAPADLRLDPLDRGFVVTRTYEAVGDPQDVSRDADGTWRLRLGATVRVRLTMVAESQRTHVALVDPLPAGLEILNPELANSPAVPEDPVEDGPEPVVRCVGGPAVECPWTPVWFDHQAVRDDRAEVFAGWLNGGVYDYSYVARATTPGTFVAPPARAEEMYAPETFGRAASDAVIIA